MALSKEAVKEAKRLLKKLLHAENKGANPRIIEFEKTNPDHQTKVDVIFGYHPHGDGWENVFIQLKVITPKQRKIWEEEKKKVPNSSFIDETPTVHGVYQIGFF